MRTLQGNRIKNLSLRFKLASSARNSIGGWLADLPADERIMDSLLGRRSFYRYVDLSTLRTDRKKASYETGSVRHYFLNAA